MIDVKKFLEISRDIVEQQIKDRSTDAICEIDSVNEDGTLNVFILPDRQTILKNIINESRYSFKRGDNALLYKIHNRLSDSFIIAKFRPRQEDAGISKKEAQSIIDDAIDRYINTSKSGGEYISPTTSDLSIKVNNQTFNPINGNITLPDYAKIGAADNCSVLSKIQYLSENDLPDVLDVGTEYAITDLISYEDLNSDLQYKISSEEIVDITLKKQYNNTTSDRTYGAIDSEKLAILNNNSKARISLSYSDIGGILLSKTRTDQNGTYYTNTLSLMTYDGTIASFTLRLNLNTGIYWLISIPLMSRPDIMTEIDKVVIKKVSITTSLTSGTLSEEELTTLTDNEQNYISLNGDNYYLSKSSDDSLKYTNVNEENRSLNTISVTTANGAWNLTSTLLATQAESQCVFAYNGATLFPVVGQINKIYIDTSENVMYRYDTDTSKYVIIGQNPNNITQIKGTYPLLG